MGYITFNKRLVIKWRCSNVDFLIAVALIPEKNSMATVALAEIIY